MNHSHLAEGLLKYYGMDPEKDVVTVHLVESATRLQAVQGGFLTGTMLDLNFALQAGKMGLRLLVDAGDVTQQLMGGLGTSDQRIKEKPDQVLRFRGYVKALRYVTDPKNRDATINIMVSDLQFTPEDAARVYETNVRRWLPEGAPPEDLVKKEIEAAKAETKLDKDVPVSQVFDYSFVNKLKQ